MDIEILNQRVADGLVRFQSHPVLPLKIYNYAERCQYDKLWDEVTLQCRGLVMHGDKVVARPFRKFFNDTEHKPEELPWHLGCEVTEKLDGSLGILFHFEGSWIWATRGSFTSDQAGEAEAMCCGDWDDILDPAITYLFEIIYPQNRIVVNYGDRRELVLLGMVDTSTGIELPLDEAPCGIPVVRRLPANANYRDLRSIIRDDEEGYVIRFSNGFRVKVKGSRYVELHRLLSGVSSRTIWECLSLGKPLDDILAVVPDEFGDWIRSEVESQTDGFRAMYAKAREGFEQASELANRKDQAALILSRYKDVSGACFAMLDGKQAAACVWKVLYPELRRPQCTSMNA